MGNPSLPAELSTAAAQGAISSSSFGISQRFAGGKTTETTLVESAAPVNLLTPEADIAATVYWVALNTPESNTEEVQVYIGFASGAGYTWFLGRPGAFMHWEPLVGEPGEPFFISASAAQKIAVCYTYTEGGV